MTIAVLAAACGAPHVTLDGGSDSGPPRVGSAESCCPGQVFSQVAGVCADDYIACARDTDCEVTGQFCDSELGVFPQGMGCTFHECGSNTDCASGLSCFDGFCVGAAPCDGGCSAGSVCTPVNNLCFPLASPSTSCQQSCTAGTMLVFSNGHNVFDTCDPSQKSSCTCETLP